MSMWLQAQQHSVVIDIGALDLRPPKVSESVDCFSQIVQDLPMDMFSFMDLIFYGCLSDFFMLHSIVHICGLFLTAEV